MREDPSMKKTTRHVTGRELVERYSHDGPPSDLAQDPPSEPPLETPDIEADLTPDRSSGTKDAAGRTRRR